MQQDLPEPEKIRFRRDEITDLGAFPSAAADQRNLTPRRGRRNFAGKIALGILAGAGSLVLIAVFALSVSGVGSERLRAEAEKAIEQMVGVDMVAALGSVRLRLDRSWFPAIEVRDVSFRNAADGSEVAEAGLLRFGFHLMPLLSGQIRLSSATFGNARLVAAAVPSAGVDWTAPVRNEEGLIDPDRLAEAVFQMMGRSLDAVQMQSTRRITLEDIEVVLSGQLGMKLVRIATARLAEAGEGSLALTAEMEIDGRAVTIAATAQRDPVSRRILALDATASSPAPQTGVDAASTAGTRVGSVEVKLAGVEGDGSAPSRLTANMTLKGSEIDLKARGVVSGDIDLAASLTAGEGRIDLDRLLVISGRSILDFEGAVTSQTVERGQPAYRYRVASRKSSISPEGSPEPPLDARIAIEGKFDPASRILHADNIVLTSGGLGEVLGAASIELVEAKAPGLSAAFSMHDMSVSHLKQLWPWFGARPARLWVLANLFGGRVSEGRLQFKIEPGRLGNGIPLSAEESFGVINVRDTRFDTAGLLPPVRDAVGSVDFRGNDVDISLESGSMFMPSGRTVRASNGKLAIRKANVKPVIGKLDIDVAGDAPALAELASLDPINAMRFIEFASDDLAGEASGNVKADIPLHKGIDASTLDWLVALDYKGLAIAKPVDGQMITEAEGSIVVMPGKAEISAKAKLGGVPAEIDLVEPLGKSTVAKERKVVLVLDEKARDILVPGLSAYLDGTVRVQLDRLGEGKQAVAADLTEATLDIPWAGWTKGPGIAGKVDFVLETGDGTSRLSDFSLSGKSFAVDGTVTLARGGLASARLSKVRLNRGDDVAVSVDRKGKNYAVDISGSAFDARAVVKQFTSDKETATKGSGGGSVSVSADVGSLAGFHGEQLSNVKLDYTGSGDTVTELKISATTKSGGAVAISNDSAGGRRTMQMESGDAGAILRFLDIYENMEGGAIRLTLAGDADAPMTGQVDARDFFVVNEPRLGSIVASAPPGDNRSLSQAARRDIDVSRVKFERGFSEIDKGKGYLSLAKGVLRGPAIGATFQGTLFDKAGNMDMTGTFMPAYGLNRIFGELPLIGVILGNGRDRGLIGVTFKLSGKASAPNLQINPLSVIAPGIFRSIFEFQ